MENVIGSSYVKPTPAFSFHTIVDEDMSLILTVASNYYDRSVFDFSGDFYEEFPKLIHKVYYRTVENPLKLFAKEGADEKFLDECYIEFMKDKEDEILENGIVTEIPTLIRLFKDSSGISPSIFYYNEDQLEALQQIEELNDIDKVEYKKISNDTNSQIFLRDHNECANFPNMKSKTFYFASTIVNLNAMEKMEEYEHLTKIANNGNRISLYDMYNTEVIGTVRVNEKGELQDEF